MDRSDQAAILGLYLIGWNVIGSVGGNRSVACERSGSLILLLLDWCVTGSASLRVSLNEAVLCPAAFGNSGYG
jgi:hypothetical protein